MSLLSWIPSVISLLGIGLTFFMSRTMINEIRALKGYTFELSNQEKALDEATMAKAEEVRKTIEQLAYAALGKALAGK